MSFLLQHSMRTISFLTRKLRAVIQATLCARDLVFNTAYIYELRSSGLGALCAAINHLTHRQFFGLSHFVTMKLAGGLMLSGLALASAVPLASGPSGKWFDRKPKFVPKSSFLGC